MKLHLFHASSLTPETGVTHLNGQNLGTNVKVPINDNFPCSVDFVWHSFRTHLRHIK